MPVKIRLQRTGRKNTPFYRVVVADEKIKRNGKTLAILGYFDPKTTPVTLKVDQKELKRWLKTGAQPSEPVRKLFSL